ncbi:nucleotidyltransferase family protein [Bdellovibrio sp. HCB337]|uniref:nucleotidyltransferase family protein n=1 Tax=Bdellovibrio sp. HCB337 TaxID=3394358 RepID=UPI0039A6128C
MNFLLLAAGHGQRMGVNKALMTYQGEPWILHQLRQLIEIDLKNITVVTNPSSESQLQTILDKAPQPVQLLTNPNPDKGPFSSLQLAIAASPDDASFVSPIDVPLRTSTLKKLRQAWLQYNQLDALIPGYKDRRGHPVILSSDFQRRLLNLHEGDPQARLDFALQALPENKKRTLIIEDPFITLNLNTPEDLATLV